METQELQEQEIQDLDTQEESETPQKNYRGKSTLKRLKDRLKTLDTLIHDKTVKAAKRADLCIEAAGIEKLLFQADRDDEADKTLALNATLTAEVARLSEENARLTQALANAHAAKSVQPERIPDSALQEQVDTLAELLKSSRHASPWGCCRRRTRHAVSLTLQYGKSAMPAVEGLGVGFSAAVTTLQKGETEILTLLELAQRDGVMCPIYRAVLAVKYEIQVDGHGRRQHPDVFAESNLYADTL